MTPENGKGRLEEAVALLLNAQASLATAQATLANTQAATLTLITDQNARFQGIEERLGMIEAALIRHEQILRNLPEAIRDKIGFKQPKDKRP